MDSNDVELIAIRLAEADDMTLESYLAADYGLRLYYRLRAHAAFSAMERQAPEEGAAT